MKRVTGAQLEAIAAAECVPIEFDNAQQIAVVTFDHTAFYTRLDEVTR